MLNTTEISEQQKLIEIEQEAWRSVNAMFEEKARKLIKELKLKDKLIEEKDKLIEEKDKLIEEKNKIIEELMRK